MNFILILLLLPAVLTKANINRDYNLYPDENILEVSKLVTCCPCPSNVQLTLFSSGQSQSQQQSKDIQWDEKNIPTDKRLDEMMKVINRFE